METSGFAERSATRGLPAWALLVPLWVSFLALQLGLWGIDWCGDGAVCHRLDSSLSWLAAGFPHAFVYALAMLGLSVPAIFVLSLGLDIGLSVMAWLRLPRRVSLGVFLGAIVAWLALSGLTVLMQPHLMVWAWVLSNPR